MCIWEGLGWLKLKLIVNCTMRLGLGIYSGKDFFCR